MPLKTVVKVGKITNLSDARYCSGMGVDMLGFSVSEKDPAFVSPKLFQEIRGWISGPKVVAEISGEESLGKLPTIIGDYAPDLLEMDIELFEKYASGISLPVIVRIHGSHPRLSPEKDDRIAYVVAEISDIPENPLPYPTLVKLSPHHNVRELTADKEVAGIALEGSSEVRPGYKDYDTLSDILDQLDEY